MKNPLRITLRDIEPSPAIEASVRAHAEKLERFCPTLISCHVTIDSPHRHKTHGRSFRVHIELGVPGATVVVTGDDRAEDAYAAINRAFSHAARQLLESSHRLRSSRHGASGGNDDARRLA